MLNLIVEHRAELPLLMQPLSGNSNDTASFGQLIKTHIDQLNTTHQVDYWVADSALYSQANLQILSAHQGRWITRVPEKNKRVRQQCVEVGELLSSCPATVTAGLRSTMAGCASAG